MNIALLFLFINSSICVLHSKMSNIDSCCIRAFVEDKCHSERWRAQKIFHKINTFTKEDIELLKLRVTGLNEVENKSICDYHVKRYLTLYSSSEWKCSDPYSTHTKSVISKLIVCSLEFSKEIKKICKLSIIPGQKVCVNCLAALKSQIESFKNELKYCIDPFNRHRNKIDNQLCCLKKEYIDYLKEHYNLTLSSEHQICNACSEKINTDIDNLADSLEIVSVSQALPLVSDTKSDNSQSTSTSGSEFKSDSQKRKNLDEVLDALGIPLFKRQKLSDKRIVDKGATILENTVENVTRVFEDTHKVKLPEYKNLKQMHFESCSFKKIIENLQLSYNVSTFDKRVSILTLMPSNWNFKDFSQYFQCTRYMVYEAKKLQAIKGNSKIILLIY